MADDDDSISTRRGRREKKDKFSKFEKLKQGKGQKHKAEVSEEVDKVYDEVDESEYKRRVRERQNDDWITDGDCGYVEDGREIFDDDLDEESVSKAMKERKKEKAKKRRKGDKDEIDDEVGGSSGNIRHMLLNMRSKKTKLDTGSKNEELMDNLVKEFCSDTNSMFETKKSIKTKPKPVVINRPPPVNLHKPKPIVIKQEPIVIDDISESQFIDNCDTQMSDNMFDANELDIIEAAESQAIVESSQMQKPVPPKVQIEKVAEQDKMETVTHNIEDSWLRMSEKMEEKPVVIETTVSDGQLPLVKLDNGDEVLRMFWFDAFEDPFKHPGVVYLFGKVQLNNEGNSNNWASICLIVKNVDKHVFFLPRQYASINGVEQTDKEIGIADLYSEFNTKVASKYKIMEFKSRSVTKKYAFNIPGVPVESEYLEVVYPGNGPILPSDLQGETFSKVFATNTSSLETLLIQRRLKGPCWLDIKNAKRATNPISWCKLEASIADASDIKVYNGEKTIPVPTLTTMTLNLRMAINPKKLTNEVVMASCLISTEFPADKEPPQPLFQKHFCIISRPTDTYFPLNYNSVLGKNSNFKVTTLHRVDSERALLSLLLTLIFKNDPDLIVGHDIAHFGLPTLLQQFAHFQVENWSRIGRLRRAHHLSAKHHMSQHEMRGAICGRLLCDIKLSAQELLRCRSYDLETLCQTILKVKEDDRIIVGIDETRLYYKDADTLRKLVCLTMEEASMILKIMTDINAIPLALQITNIAGNVMSRTLMGGRSERNEYLLLHAFTDKGYIVPDKIYGAKKDKINENDENEEGGNSGGKGKNKGRKKAAYSGGLVLEPKKGFYDNYILLMDFNSLYPSIIQEYNICFTTLINNFKKDTIVNDGEEEDNLAEILSSLSTSQSAAPGVLPTEIRALVEKRRAVKGILAGGNITPEVKMQLNIRQLGLKLTANSMYGCLGFSNSRFYAKHLAALITAKGREILMHTKTLVERMGLDVVYGDTDSIMINTRSTSYDEVLKLGFRIKGEVNKLYQNVELEIDGIFKYLLLLKKKKYAALTISRLPDGTFKTEQELKGLDIVRRDWAPLATQTGKYVVNLLLCDMAADERLFELHEHLYQLKGKLERGEIQLNELAVAKTLARPPEHYTDKKGLPHVTVALRMNSKGGRKFKQGDTVQYVICKDGTNNAATQRAYHLDEMKANPELTVDMEYYLSNQIHPVVSRLVECLDGTDPVRIAECLGLDGSSYKHTIKNHEDDEINHVSQFTLPEKERFKNCEKFKFKCVNPSCRADIEIDSVYLEKTKIPVLALEHCPHEGCTARPIDSLPYLQNCLAISIREYISKYYQQWFVCEDPRCRHRVKGIHTNKFYKSNPVCNKCKQNVLVQEYSEHDLHQQIYFYRDIFNISKFPQLKRQVSRESEAAYLKLKEQADKFINQSSYCLVDLTTIFKKLQTKK